MKSKKVAAVTAATNGNREAWLMKATKAVTPLFTKAGYTVPEVRVCAGFPSRSAIGARQRRIGECWSAGAAADNRAQIFISPVLEDYVVVLATLVHELVHAVVGHEAKHGPVFKKCATAVGLAGKMTATHAGDELVAKFEALRPRLGAYPHTMLNAMTRTKQTTRLLKCACEECGYTVRTTAKWIDEAGAPLCPCNSEPMKVS